MEHVGDCFLVPGPTRMSEACRESMATATITARGSEFREIMARLNSGLRYAFNLSPSSDKRGQQSWEGNDGYKVIVASGSGTGAMEMIIANRFGKQDNVLIPSNGKFGERVAEMAMRYCNVTHIRYEWGQSFDIEQLEQLSKNNNFDSLIICHNETSAGITQDAKALSTLASSYGMGFILDGITSVGGIEVCPEAWNAEAVVVGAQKCTAGPSGIAAIAINEKYISESNHRRENQLLHPAYYFDLQFALKKGDDDQTPWTPSIIAAQGWATSLEILKDEGLENRISRCANMAKGVRKLFLDAGFRLLADNKQRSDTVTAILYPEGIDDKWKSRLKETYQTQVIGGQDHLKGKMFRVGTMGETPIEEIIEGCKRMMLCFKDMGHSIKELDVESYFR